MEFTVPQFIEREARIVGPMTFRQFVYVGSAGAVCLFLYFTVSLWVFIISTVILMTVACFFAFVKIQGRTLPTVLKNFSIWLISSRVFFWRAAAPKVIKKVEKPKKEEKEEPALKIAGKSHLRDLSTRLEIKQR